MPPRCPRAAAPRPRLALALALVACPERQAAPGPAPAPTAAAPVPAPPEVPTHRPCGEAGATPTELPPRLLAGPAPIGRATLRPGDARTLGTAELRYDRSAWIGTHRAGFRAPGLHVLIDQAEAGGGPWGNLLQLHPGQVTHFFVGPYRFDVRVAPGDPPAEVDVTIQREGCPAAAVIEPSTTPRSLWVSTDGIRLHTYDLAGALLQVALDAHGELPRLDVSMLAYRQWFEPRPGPPRSVRVGTHRVTLDRVVPGPDTRFTDRWHAAGEARLHARVTLEPLPPATPAAPVAATTACGDPGPARTTLPADLSVLPPELETTPLSIGRKAQIGPLRLEFTTFEVPASGGGPYREEARQVPLLQIVGDPADSRGVPGPFTAPRLVRAGTQLLRIEPVSADTLAIRRVVTRCPRQRAIAPPSEPTHLWLSTLGHAVVTVGDPGALILQIHEDPAAPSLALTAPTAYFSRTIGPDLVGLGFTLDDHLVEIVDVQTDTRLDAPFPAVHVQLKLSPADAR